MNPLSFMRLHGLTLEEYRMGDRVDVEGFCRQYLVEHPNNADAKVRISRKIYDVRDGRAFEQADQRGGQRDVNAIRTGEGGESLSPGMEAASTSLDTQQAAGDE